eukprot:gene5930-252_t
MPDISLERDDITIHFCNRQYLKSPEFMSRNVSRTVDLHKPLIFTGKKVDIAAHFFTAMGGIGKSALTTVIMKLLLEDRVYITSNYEE